MPGACGASTAEGRPSPFPPACPIPATGRGLRLPFAWILPGGRAACRAVTVRRAHCTPRAPHDACALARCAATPHARPPASWGAPARTLRSIASCTPPCADESAGPKSADAAPNGPPRAPCRHVMRSSVALQSCRSLALPLATPSCLLFVRPFADARPPCPAQRARGMRACASARPASNHSCNRRAFASRWPAPGRGPL
jgi:hypothetical protein